MHYYHAREKFEKRLAEFERKFAGGEQQPACRRDEESLYARLASELALCKAAAVRDQEEIARLRIALDNAQHENQAHVTAALRAAGERTERAADHARLSSDAQQFMAAAEDAERRNESLSNENRFLKAELGYSARELTELRARAAEAESRLEEKERDIIQLVARLTAVEDAEKARRHHQQQHNVQQRSTRHRYRQVSRKQSVLGSVVRWLKEPMIVVYAARPSSAADKQRKE